jgi:hypothetical protein
MVVSLGEVLQRPAKGFFTTVHVEGEVTSTVLFRSFVITYCETKTSINSKIETEHDKSICLLSMLSSMNV